MGLDFISDELKLLIVHLLQGLLTFFFVTGPLIPSSTEFVVVLIQLIGWLIHLIFFYLDYSLF